MPPVEPYCTDEDCWLRAAGDYPELVPVGGLLARGTEGAISAAEPWALYGQQPADLASVGPGNLVYLYRPGIQRPYSTDYGSPVDVLAVVGPTGDGAGLILRRPGQLAGVGCPPVVTGYGLPYWVGTLSPLIEDESYDLDQRYEVDDALAGRRFADLADSRQLRRACVLATLASAYRAAAAMMASAPSDGRSFGGDNFTAKSAAFKAELGDLIGRVTVRFRASQFGAGAADVDNTSIFGRRISR